MLRGVLAWLVLGGALGWFTVHLEATHVGAAGTSWQLDGAERVLVAGRAVWFYLGSLVWPFGLCFNYPRWTLDAASPADWAFPIAAVAAMGAAWLLRHRLGRGPLAALLLYGGTLVPALGFFDVFPFRYSFVADHFQYHASAAMLAAIAGTAAALASPRIGGNRGGRWSPAGVVALLAVLTFRQCGVYRDLETLWTHTLACNPDSMLALTNLGGLELDRGNLAAAKELFERSLALDAGNYEAVANLGVVAHKSGDRPLARQRYEQALAMRPDFKETMTNLAVLHFEDDRPEQAWPLVERAVAIDPDFHAARVMACRTLTALRRWQDALAHAGWVLARTPDAHDTRLELAECLLAQRQDSLAAGHAAHVLQNRPGDARARGIMAKALARIVAAGDAVGAGERAAQGCRSGKVDPAVLLPLVAEELRALGAAAHAVDVESLKPGG
jgi:tetratricopeptide (TPR) repeat protein